LSLGLNAFAVPDTESFGINELAESARDLRTFLVRAAAILPHMGTKMWPRLTYRT